MRALRTDPGSNTLRQASWAWQAAAGGALEVSGLQGSLRALAETFAAVCQRLAGELRQSKAEPQPSVCAAQFVAAAFAREEAVWLSLCCQVRCA